MKAWGSCIPLLKSITSRYRGVAAPLLQKTLSTSLMFGVYDYYIQLFEYEYTKYLKRVNGKYIVRPVFDE